MGEINVKGRQHKAVAGCKVRNGTIAKNAKVRVMRKGEKVFDGTLASLKNVKKDVQEMKKGGECGMALMIGSISTLEIKSSLMRRRKRKDTCRLCTYRW